MTERIHYDNALVEPPTRLNPVTLAATLSKRGNALLGKFSTNVTVRYTPYVSTQTAGTVAIGISHTPESTLHSISALSPSYTGPIWKPAQLNIPKALLNTQNWATSETGSYYLVVAGSGGNITITCTVQLQVAQQDKSYYSYDKFEELPYLTTTCYVGPRLEGFSLVCGMPLDPNEWGGYGQTINVDLTRASGRTTSSQAVCTPETKYYIAVMFSFGSQHKLEYDAYNASFEWHDTFDTLYNYEDQGPPWGATRVGITGKWRPVAGSTQGWCSVKGKSIRTTVNGSAYTFWYPYTILILYYYYPGIRIYDDAFKPGIRVQTKRILPRPPGLAQPNESQYIPLMMATIQALWSRYWYPESTPLQTLQFSRAKQALEDWPTTDI